MNEVVAWVIALPASYIVGSVPTGIVTGRLLRGVDVRQYGSGNTGATNVLRTLGPIPAIMVLLLDWGKGAAVIFIARALSDSPWLSSVVAVGVIVGHSWPVFAGFRGGKGVATGLGALTIISPLAGLLAACGVFVALATRYVSVGSMAGTAAGLVTLIVLILIGQLDAAYLVFAIGGFVIIEARHRSNFMRVIRGTESRLSIGARPRRARAKQA